MTLNWKNFANKGKFEEQIRNLKSIFYSYKGKIVQEINSLQEDNFQIFTEKKKHYTLNFEAFLDEFFKKINTVNKNNYDLKIYERAYNKFRKELFNYLNKRFNQNLIGELKFDNGYSLYKLFEAFEKINSRITFRINNNKIEAYSINKSKICLIKILFDAKNYQFYYSRPIEISISLNNLIKFLKCRKNDKIETRLIFKEDKLNLELNSKLNKSLICRTLEEIEENQEKDGIFEELLNLEYLGFFEIDDLKLKYLISQLGRVSEAIKLTLFQESIKFNEENSVGAGDIIWKKESISRLELESEEINVCFSINYLKLLTDFLFEDKPSIRFFLEKEIPMKIKIDFKSLGNTIGLFFIAQRELY